MRPHDGTGRPPQIGPGRRRGHAAGDGLGSDRRHDRHRRGRARRGADALHRREGRDGARHRRGRIPRSTSPSIRSKGRTCAPPARPTRWPCWRRPRVAACSTRPTSTWRSWSSARAPAMSSTWTRPFGSISARSRRPTAGRVEDLVVIVLDRPRHAKLIDEIRDDRRPHPPDRRRRSFGWYCCRRRRQRRARGDGYRRRTGRRAHGGCHALPRRRDLRSARRQQPGARAALPRDGHHRHLADLSLQGSRLRERTSSLPRPASRTAR